MTGLPRLTFMELKLFLREPLAVYFAVAFPALLVGILGSVPGFREPKQDIGGLRVIDLYVPIAIAFVLVMLSLNLVPATLATYRERGILRRLATTPVGPTALLAAQMVMSLLMAVFAALLVLAVGLVLAAVVPTARSAQGFGTVLFFPMMFFAGLWVPRAAMPGTLRDISDFTPLGATVQALQDAAGGGWPQSLHLAVMAAYAAVFGLLAMRTFRWQ